MRLWCGNGGGVGCDKGTVCCHYIYIGGINWRGCHGGV